MNERDRLREERKRQLIAAGAAYRLNAVEARQQLGANLQGESLAKKAMSQLALTAFAAFKSRKSGGVQNYLPLIVSGVLYLAKKTSAKPKLRKLAIAGAAGVLAAIFAKRILERRRQAREEKASRKRRA